MPNSDLFHPRDRTVGHPAHLPEWPPGQDGQAGGAGPEQDDLASAGLLDYWRILLRHKWMVLSLTVAGVLTGFLVTIPSPFLFGARTLIAVQDFNQNFMGMAQVDPQAGNYSPTELNIATELRILESGTLNARVFERLNRELVPSAPPEVSGVVARLRRQTQEFLGRAPKDPLIAMRRALGTASATLELEVVQGTRLIEIRCRSTIPEVAAAFANAIASEYIEESLEQRIKSLQRSTQWFNTQLQEMKTKVEESQQRLHALRSPEGAVGAQGAPQSLTAARIASLQQQVGAAHAERIAKEAQLQTLAASPGSDALLDTTALEPYRAKVEEARRTLSTLTEDLTPAHYKVQRAQSDLAVAEEELKQQREALVVKLRAELEGIRERERLLTSAYTGQMRSMSTQSGNALEYSLLHQEVENYRQQYQLLLQQAGQAAVASAVPANHIRIVEPAGPSDEPVNVFESTAMALGGFTGLLLSLAGAIVLHHINRSVRGPGHASNVLGVRELGVVLSGNSRLIQSGRRNGAVRGLLPPGDAVSTQFVAEDHPVIADSFRAILASILLPYRKRVPQVIVVSSPDMKEGKSTVASNLGMALSELKRRVLLIDADLRRPQLHRMFGIRNTAGLASILTGTENIALLKPDELGVSAGKGNLRVLAAGPAIPNVNALLYSARLGELLVHSRGHYDHIIIDTPPLLRFPDARLLGTQSDGVVLVLRAGVTDIANAVAARDLLAQDSIRLIGTILNDWSPKKRELEQYTQYQKYYTQTAD
jgi:capsular exopolysaccharide synthesis family protein